MKILNHLQLYQLKKFCRKYGLDEMEIDSTLTYSENKAYLMKLVPDFGFVCERQQAEYAEWLKDDRDSWKSAEEEYEHFVRENFLMFYLDYQRNGETTSAEVGEQDNSPSQFSLSRFVTMRNQRRVALRMKHKV